MLFGVALASIIGMAPDCPETIHNSMECARYRENWVVENSSGVVQRFDNQLRVRLVNGTTLAVTDYYGDENSESAFKAYTAIGYFPENKAVMLEVQHYEGGNFEYFDLGAGRRFTVFGEPSISPDGKWLVTYASDMYANYSPSGLWVFSLRDGVPYLSGDFPGFVWGVTSLTWDGLYRARFDCEYFPENPESFDLKKGKGILEFVNGRWAALCDGKEQVQKQSK